MVSAPLKFRASAHLEPLIIVENRNPILNNAVKVIRDNKLHPTGIVGCGLSGVMFAALLANKLNIEPVLVRKTTDTKNHSMYSVEGLRNKERNFLLIVDDLVDTGATIKYIKETVRDFSTKHKIKVEILPIGLLYSTKLTSTYEEITFHGVQPNYM